MMWNELLFNTTFCRGYAHMCIGYRGKKFIYLLPISSGIILFLWQIPLKSEQGFSYESVTDRVALEFKIGISMNLASLIWFIFPSQ